MRSSTAGTEGLRKIRQVSGPREKISEVEIKAAISCTISSYCDVFFLSYALEKTKTQDRPLEKHYSCLQNI